LIQIQKPVGDEPAGFCCIKGCHIQHAVSLDVEKEGAFPNRND
jgi:hypothetical protein